MMEEWERVYEGVGYEISDDIKEPWIKGCIAGIEYTKKRCEAITYGFLKTNYEYELEIKRLKDELSSIQNTK